MNVSIQNSSAQMKPPGCSRIAPVLRRAPLVMVTVIFSLISLRYLFDPIHAAAAAGISFTSPGGITVARVGFAAFPLSFAIFASYMDDSLSMAFLVLLERLTPVERAVFLLREVFDYEYAEIARILEQSEPNCRQILRRARQHLRHGRPRFDPSPRQHEELLRRFLEASALGDMDGLLGLISKEIVLYADGGGKATAVPNPIYGADNVVRFLVGARRKLLPTDLVRQVAQINGQPGVVSYLHGRPHSVLTMEVTHGRICNIYIVSNPDKLAQLPMLPPAPC
jgi:sigma-70-like protein